MDKDADLIKISIELEFRYKDQLRCISGWAAPVHDCTGTEYAVCLDSLPEKPELSKQEIKTALEKYLGIFLKELF